MITALLVAILSGAPAEGLLVRGTVRDPSGLPVPGVLVYVKASQQQAATDQQGTYQLLVLAPPPFTIVAFHGGFRPREIEVAGPQATAIDIVLELAPLAFRVTVGAAAHAAPPGTLELRPLDVVRTPGSQADVFRTLQTLPGVVAIDEGAGIYVRGGDVGETGVFLDGVALAHPYRYESPTGGWFGSVEPFLLEGMAFTSAAFPARFGGVLGAVLDLTGLGQPASRQIQLTAGLAGASGKLALPLGEGSGVRLSGNRTLTGLLFAVNGTPQRFDINPSGWDLNLSAHHASTSLGALKLFGFAQSDAVGVEVEQDAFVGFLHNRTRQRFFGARWARSLGTWEVSASAGRDRYTKTTDVGVLALLSEDSMWSGRLNLERSFAAASLRLGADGALVRAQMSGRKPAHGGDFEAVQGAYEFAMDHDDWRAGAYVEAERALGRLLPSLGLRLEHFGRSRETSALPRLRTRLRIAGAHALTLAWGLHRQAPSPGFFDPYFAADNLRALRSEHRVAGYEWGGSASASQVRIEAYDKRYDHLPLHDGPRVTSEGHGFARGVDVFARRAFARGELRANYSWLYARRRFTPLEQVGRYELPAGTWPPDFAIPHSAHVVGTVRPLASLSVGFGLRLASGRPHTPIVAAARDGSPVFGDINSERLPRYERLDLSASHSRKAFGRGLLVAFAGVTNLLAHQNSFQYVYSSDFRSRRPVTSSAPRSFYVGAALTR